MTLDEFRNSLKARKFFGLTPQQWEILSLLTFREQVLYSQIYETLWENPDGEPEHSMKVIHKNMHRLRTRLKPLGLRVQLVWGKGFFLSKKDRQTILELTMKALEA